VNQTVALKPLLLTVLLCGAAAAHAGLADADRLPVFDSAADLPPSRDAFGFDSDGTTLRDATLKLAVSPADLEPVVFAPPTPARVGVPEPAGWGSMLAGLGLLRMLRRRRVR
jgi:hypothetical protein